MKPCDQSIYANRKLWDVTHLLDTSLVGSLPVEVLTLSFTCLLTNTNIKRKANYKHKVLSSEKGASFQNTLSSTQKRAIPFSLFIGDPSNRSTRFGAACSSSESSSSINVDSTLHHSLQFYPHSASRDCTPARAERFHFSSVSTGVGNTACPLRLTFNLFSHHTRLAAPPRKSCSGSTNACKSLPYLQPILSPPQSTCVAQDSTSACHTTRSDPRRLSTPARFAFADVPAVAVAVIRPLWERIGPFEEPTSYAISSYTGQEVGSGFSPRNWKMHWHVCISAACCK